MYLYELFLRLSPAQELNYKATRVPTSDSCNDGMVEWSQQPCVRWCSSVCFLTARDARCKMAVVYGERTGKVKADEK